jgi:hypothetical protein
VLSRRGHSEEACDRYIKGFKKVLKLHSDGIPAENIASEMEMSKSLVKQYVEIIEDLAKMIFKEIDNMKDVGAICHNSHFLCSYGSGSDPIINDDFLGGSVMGRIWQILRGLQRASASGV